MALQTIIDDSSFERCAKNLSCEHFNVTLNNCFCLQSFSFCWFSQHGLNNALTHARDTVNKIIIKYKYQSCFCSVWITINVIYLDNSCVLNRFDSCNLIHLHLIVTTGKITYINVNLAHNYIMYRTIYYLQRYNNES